MENNEHAKNKNVDLNETNLRIRKLTPKECFRLMGFDDRDVDILSENGISNTQLYKMAGNSIVVNVLEGIFRNLIWMGMDTRLKEIADHYGIGLQLRQLAEECSELAVEANHSARKGCFTIGLVEEMADVEIMMEQIKYLCDIRQKDIEEVKNRKIERQLERIKEEAC